jgi:hypothetical protein
VGQRTLLTVLLADAIGYMIGQWRGLNVFLDDPRVAIDNNSAEGSLRGVVLGTKKHYGSHSERGTKVASLMYSLAETCKLLRVEPRSYLKAAVTARLRRQPMSLPLPQEYAATLAASSIEA